MDGSDQWIDPATGQPVDGAPLGLLLSIHAELTPDRPAMTIGRRSYSFAEFDRAANRRARALADNGVDAGDRVILAMANRAEYLESAFALWKIGATPCPVSHTLPSSVLCRQAVDFSASTHSAN